MRVLPKMSKTIPLTLCNSVLLQSSPCKYKTLNCFTGVMIKSEINLFTDNSLQEEQQLPSMVSCDPLHRPPLIWRPQTLPRHTAANCIVTLQICSCNQLSLSWGTNLTTGMIRILGGSPLLTWDRDESSITMKLEIACHCYLPVFLSSFSIQPFCPCPRLSPLFYPSEMW